MRLHGPGPMLAGVRVALAQINPAVGDLARNRRLVDAAEKAQAAAAELMVLGRRLPIVQRYGGV